MFFSCINLRNGLFLAARTCVEDREQDGQFILCTGDCPAIKPLNACACGRRIKKAYMDKSLKFLTRSLCCFLICGSRCTMSPVRFFFFLSVCEISKIYIFTARTFFQVQDLLVLRLQRKQILHLAMPLALKLCQARAHLLPVGELRLSLL